MNNYSIKKVKRICIELRFLEFISKVTEFRYTNICITYRKDEDHLVHGKQNMRYER